MKIFLATITLLIVLISCQENHTSQTLSMDDIVSGDSSDYHHTKSDTVVVKDTFKLDEDFQKFANEVNLDKLTIRNIDSILYVDRFDHISSYKYQLEDPKYHFFIASWKFRNSNSAQNAFINWTQCFGPKCRSLKINDSISISNKHMAMILTKDELFYLEGISEKEYKTFTTSIIKWKKLKMIDYTFYQDGKKGVKWYKFPDFISKD